MNSRPGKKKKNIPIFSHEYVITNHGDIVSFIAMIFVVGLMFKATTPLATLFIGLGHNATINGSVPAGHGGFYTTGRLDFLCVFFYTLICIIIHAVIQEYGLDKLNRKFHLSKTKYNKFNESGQLAVFYFISVFWICHNAYHESLFKSLSSLWDPYPSLPLPFWVKMFFIIQISYWLHGYPELYFQKVKRSEMPGRILYTTLYLLAITIGYVVNMARFTISLLAISYAVDCLFHLCRLLHFIGKTNAARIGFMAWNVLFVVARILIITLSYITLFFGLEKQSVDKINLREGNFNTRLLRINGLLFIFVLQGFMMWRFLTFHVCRVREKNNNAAFQDQFAGGAKKSPSAEKKKGKSDRNEISDLPEADQHQEIRKRGKAKGK